MTALPVWLRAAAFIVVVPGTIAGWLPRWIAGEPPLPPAPWSSVRTAGAAVAALGWGVLLWCALDFARRGRGTPAPYDPPRALVTGGLYRYVRNPMYVGVLTAILGQAWWYRSTAVLAYAAVTAFMFHLRVVLYEEPRLARDFGAEVDAYRGRVPRWLPRRPRS